MNTSKAKIVSVVAHTCMSKSSTPSQSPTSPTGQSRHGLVPEHRIQRPGTLSMPLGTSGFKHSPTTFTLIYLIANLVFSDGNIIVSVGGGGLPNPGGGRIPMITSPEQEAKRDKLKKISFSGGGGGSLGGGGGLGSMSAKPSQKKTGLVFPNFQPHLGPGGVSAGVYNQAYFLDVFRQ